MRPDARLDQAWIDCGSTLSVTIKGDRVIVSGNGPALDQAEPLLRAKGIQYAPVQDSDSAVLLPGARQIAYDHGGDIDAVIDDIYRIFSKKFSPRYPQLRHDIGEGGRLSIVLDDLPGARSFYLLTIKDDEGARPWLTLIEWGTYANQLIDGLTPESRALLAAGFGIQSARSDRLSATMPIRKGEAATLLNVAKLYPR